jgi:hypothetical protein
MNLLCVSIPYSLKKLTCGIFFLALIACLIPACKKGDTGPAGATGPAGPAGSPNVMYSSWVYATGFNDSTIDNSSLKVGYVAAPAIVDSILQKGLVLVYFTYGGGTFTLPYTSNAGGKPSTISFTPMLGKILVYRFTHDNSNSIALSTQLQYRYIIVPGGVATSSFTEATKQVHVSVMENGAPDYSQMSYEEVCNALHIQQ